MGQRSLLRLFSDPRVAGGGDRNVGRNLAQSLPGPDPSQVPEVQTRRRARSQSHPRRGRHPRAQIEDRGRSASNERQSAGLLRTLDRPDCPEVQLD